MDENGYPRLVAGVPPDYFSSTGQLWGNPLYLWNEHKKNNYEWWKKRVLAALHLFDIVRIDHFRGFYNYYRIPATAKTARDGTWMDGPRDELFEALSAALRKQLKDLQGAIVAEDLGEKIDKVIKWRKKLKLAGMKILQFTFGDDQKECKRFKPKKYNGKNGDLSIMYVGTHDNNTAMGWWYSEAKDRHRELLTKCIQKWKDDPSYEITEPNWEMIQIGMESRECVFIIPLQDILGAGNSSRMNTPGVAAGNWRWRCTREELEEEKRWERLKYLTQKRCKNGQKRGQRKKKGVSRVGWVCRAIASKFLCSENQLLYK